MQASQENPFLPIIDLWKQRCPGSGLIPARSDFDMTDFMPWIGWVSIYEIEREPRIRFKIRLSGSLVARVDQKDNTGRYLDEVFPPPKYDFVYEPYMKALKTLQPVFIQRVVPTRHDIPKTLSKLVMPTAADNKVPDKFINILHYADVDDLDDIKESHPVESL